MPSTRRLVLLHERKGGSAICRPGEGAGLQVFPGSVPELAVVSADVLTAGWCGV